MWRSGMVILPRRPDVSDKEGPLRPRASKVVASTTDELGRTIVLTEERWEHILEGHPEMAGLELAVMRVVESADKECTGNFPGSRKFYKQGLGPARWLAAVVAYEGMVGKVITAHPFSKLEPRIDS